MSEQAKPVGASDKMKAKDFITLSIFTVLFFAVVMVCIFASAATVVTFAFGSAIAAIPGGIIYMLMRAKVPKAGSVLLSGVVIGLIEFLIGAGWAVAVGFIAGAVIAELLARIGHYKSFWLNTIGYSVYMMFFALGTYLPMVIMTGYVDDMSTSNGVSAEYLTELHSFMNGTMVVIIAVVTFVAGIIGALIVAFIVCRAKKLPMLPVADAAFPGVMLGQAIGRWGNFFNMEAFGTNTTLPWGMTSDTISNYLSRHQASLLAQGVTVDPGLPVHPTFLYESVWNLIGVAILLLWLFPRRSYDGQITLGYTAWYGLGRFFVEGLRTDSLMWGSVRVSQALGGVLFLIGAGLMLFFFLQSRKPMTLEYIEGQKKPRFALTRYVDTEESRQRIAMMDAKAAEKKQKNKQAKNPAQPGQKEEQHEREDH